MSFVILTPQKEPITSGSITSYSVRYGKTSAGKSEMVLVLVGGGGAFLTNQRVKKSKTKANRTLLSFCRMSAT